MRNNLTSNKHFVLIVCKLLTISKLFYIKSKYGISLYEHAV